MPTINFFLVDPDTFEDIPAGSVSIDGDKITSDNDDLLDVARSSGSTSDGIVAALSDWSNGYLRSELAQETEEPFAASGSIKLLTQDTGITEALDPEEPAPSGSIKLAAQESGLIEPFEDAHA